LIDYPGPTGTFRTISYIDVLRGNFDHHAVRGRIVVVGPTATIFGDGHRVPVDSTMPGPEIHAAAIATALAGFPLRSASALVARRIAFGAGFLVPLMLLGIAAVSRPIRGARGGGGIPLDAPGPIVVTATGAVACAAWLVLAQVEFDRGTVVELLPALIAVAVSTGATGVVASAVTRRARRRLRTRFAARDKFVVRQVLASTGRRRAVTARDVIGGYLIEEPIGSGGMGEVYRAVQIRLERRVALKLILADHALDRRYRRQFVAEAHRTAAITHPNVIAVIDAGEADGVLFIAMPFIEGSDLAQSLRNVHQLEVTYVVRVIHRVGCALDAAHAIGLVHGDVKPENILIPDRSPEHPLLVDFGVARTADEIGTRAKSGGTIAYMAPERLSGLTSGRPADVYALAAVLLGCLIGERAAREARASFADHRRSMPDARRGLPSAIGAVIATAMAADPGVRHPTATAFTRAAAAALGVTVTDDEPVPQPPARPAPSAQAEIDPTEID
jgi:serine/threonine-protein kinase